jgi:phosphomannomutase/phosphoglucomutase
VACLHCDPDGSFPNRSPDCARTGNLRSLRAAVVEQKATLGIAWDGDGDRVAFIDENGIHASTDEMAILFARHILAGTKVLENVVCDIKLSDSVRREVLIAGGMPLLERSGHAFMRSRLLSSNAILGLDACGHYFFRDAGSRDDGLYSALLLLEIINAERTLGDLRRSVSPMFNTPEMRLPAALLDFTMVRDRLRTAFRGADESAIDGSRLVLEEGVVLARESSTEAVVSLRIEGFTPSGYDNLVRNCLTSLKEADALLRQQIEEKSGV